MENNQFLDLTHEYLILVPLNETGVEDLYQGNIYKGNFINANFKYMLFNEETYYFLEKKLFDFINVECDMLINMYEEEIADPSKLLKIQDTTDLLLRNNDDEKFSELIEEFKELLKLAIEKKTCMGFYF